MSRVLSTSVDQDICLLNERIGNQYGIAKVSKAKKTTGQVVKNMNWYKKFNCNECGKFFTQKCDLERHMNCVHKGEKEFQCNQCDHKTSLKQNLTRHILGVHKKRNSYHCEQCDFRSSYAYSLKRHMLNMHQKFLNCNECNYTTRKEADLEKHKKSHRRLRDDYTLPKTFFCPMCSNFFYKEMGWSFHDIVVHSKPFHELPFQCAYYDLSFRRSLLNLDKDKNEITSGNNGR